MGFAPLVVVGQIDIGGFAFNKAEDDAPVTAHANAPEASQMALEGMESKARQIHIFRLPCAIQNRHDVFQFLSLIGLDAPGIAVFKEPP